jgi:hypothetical protein
MKWTLWGRVRAVKALCARSGEGYLVRIMYDPQQSVATGADGSERTRG